MRRRNAHCLPIDKVNHMRTLSLIALCILTLALPVFPRPIPGKPIPRLVRSPTQRPILRTRPTKRTIRPCLVKREFRNLTFVLLPTNVLRSTSTACSDRGRSGERSRQPVFLPGRTHPKSGDRTGTVSENALRRTWVAAL